MRVELKAAGTALLLAITTFPAYAAFHLMKVVEVFPGTAAAPSAQYVVIQMYASGQQFVGGHDITVFNAAGSAIATFTFPGDLANGANQAKILIATPQATTFFGLSADLVMSPAILAAGGKVCFADTIDCVAWGAYTGSATGVGTPFSASGLVSGRAAIRRLDIAGSSTVLDAADDTNNCANDFVSGLPAPRNNAGMQGTIPGATCGNGALEGLEQCDDGNLANGDGCSSTCTVTPVTPSLMHRSSGDFNGDGKSDVFWRNTSTGANTIWLSANRSTLQTVVGVTNLDWKVLATEDFNGDGKSDVFWRNTSTGINTIWLSANASTQRAVKSVTNLAWQAIAFGDFNGDGKADVFWRNTSTGANTIWLSANAATLQSVSSVTNLAWKVAGVGDFSGDGKTDVFWRNTSTGANTIWKSASSATLQSVKSVTNQDWQVVAFGDFNGDGKADVFWRNTNTGANAIWKSANAATLQSVSSVTNLAWKVAGVGDFSGDGKTDVFWRNTSTGANTIWKSASSATLQSVTGVTNLAWVVVP